MADGHPGQISIKRTLPPDAPQFVIPTKLSGVEGSARAVDVGDQRGMIRRQRI